MSNPFFEYIKNPTWKTLSSEMKKVVFQNVLRYFVNPMLNIDNIVEVSHSMGGVKTDTFEVTINKEEFVFIPGQDHVILGWDEGLKGLKGLDNSEDRQELRYAIKQYLNERLTPSVLVAKNRPLLDFSEDFLSFDLIETIIHQYTSPLRTVHIPALLVAKRPQFVGLEKIGHYSVITGNIDAPCEETYLYQIQKALTHRPEENMIFQEYPRIVRFGELLLIQHEEDLDWFHCYRDAPKSYREIKYSLDKLGMGFLSEDEWEYVCGSGTRRLFRWGNEWHPRMLLDEEHSPLWEKNMFGLTIAAPEWGQELIEDYRITKGGWIEEVHKAPLVNLLPFSSYMRQEGIFDIDRPLQAGFYTYRKSIRIEL